MAQLTLPCGANYIGEIENNQPWGDGRVTTPMRLPGGEMYIGELWNGKPRGIGSITYLNGLKFTGDFAFGSAVSGVVTDQHNTQLQGFHADVPYFGRGSHSGFYLNGLRNGHQLLTMVNGETLEGNYTADRLNGVFISTFSGGQNEVVYDNGEWKSEKEAGANEFKAAGERRAAAMARK